MKESKNNNGIGLFGAMFLVLFALKLMDVIDWSWWLVTAPLWAPVGVILAIAVVIFVASLIGGK